MDLKHLVYQVLRVIHVGKNDLTRKDKLNERSSRKVSSKRKKGQWVVGRKFQPNWVSHFPFIEPLSPIVQTGSKVVREAKCLVCSWKQGRDVHLQLKIDTIEKHVGKIYEKKILNDKETCTVRWKTTNKYKHICYSQLYEKHLEDESSKSERRGGPISQVFDNAMTKYLQSKVVQLSTIFSIMMRGRPMNDYPEYKKLLSFHEVPNFPNSHWSVSSGWEWATYMSEVIKEDLREIVNRSQFISLSLDEVTVIDNTSWVCIHVYVVDKHVRNENFLGIFKLQVNANAENIFELVTKSMKDSLGMTSMVIAKKLVCLGADGASIMQGQHNGLCVRLQTSIAPYMLGIHCMAHRTNLAFKIVSNFEEVSKVETLVKDLYSYFSKSPKRALEFCQFAKGVTNGKRLLKDVDT